jgi:hypothetical protein
MVRSGFVERKSLRAYHLAAAPSQRADPRLSESAEKSVISLSPTHQSTHVNAVRNAVSSTSTLPPPVRHAIGSASTLPPREKIFPPRISRAPTHQSTHANVNEKSARKFGERNFGNGIDDRFGDGIDDAISSRKMRAAPVRGSAHPLPLDIGSCGGKSEVPAMAGDIPKMK